MDSGKMGSAGRAPVDAFPSKVSTITHAHLDPGSGEQVAYFALYESAGCVQGISSSMEEIFPLISSVG